VRLNHLAFARDLLGVRCLNELVAQFDAFQGLLALLVELPSQVPKLHSPCVYLHLEERRIPVDPGCSLLSLVLR
jgi:hypothetical protein